MLENKQTNTTSKTNTKIKVEYSKEDDLKDVNVSKLQSTFHTPRERALKQKLTKSVMRNILKIKKIKSLQQENAQLKRKNILLLNMVKKLKDKGCLSKKIEKALGIASTNTSK